MIGVMKIMETSFKRSLAHTVVFSAPTLQQTHASTGDSCTPIGKSGSVSCGVTAPFSWVLVHTVFVSALQVSVSQDLCKFCNQIPVASKVKFPGEFVTE